MGVVEMGELAFVGLGLNDETNVSLKGLEKAKKADVVFAELYTNLMPGLSIQRLERLIKNRVQMVKRQDLEEKNGEIILTHAEKARVVLLVAGDPLIATTHIDLRIRAHKKGIKTSVVHGASIISAVFGLSCLQNYKFGRSVTIPFPNNGLISETPYNVIAENKKMGLHTLCFLDIRAEEERFMTIKEGLQSLFTLERRKRQGIMTAKTLVVGIARAGSENSAVKAEFSKELLKYDFGAPPQSLVFPGKLHFKEAEALVALAEAPEHIMKMIE
jgi:diphthine synthase